MGPRPSCAGSCIYSLALDCLTSKAHSPPDPCVTLHASVARYVTLLQWRLGRIGGEVDVAVAMVDVHRVVHGVMVDHLVTIDLAVVGVGTMDPVTQVIEHVREETSVCNEGNPKFFGTGRTRPRRLAGSSVVTDEAGVVNRYEIGLRVEILIDGIPAVAQHLIDQVTGFGARCFRRVHEPALHHEPLPRVLGSRIGRELP